MLESDICKITQEMLRENAPVCRLILSIGDTMCEIEVAILATQQKGKDPVCYQTPLGSYRDPCATLH